MRGPLALAALLVLAGCLAPGSAYHAAAGDADPPRDVLGWEDGYWYDEPLDVAAEDGLDGTERAAVVARTMARIERIRRLEFREPVPVEVIDRETFRRRWAHNRSPAYHAWNDQVWEALFLVDERTNATETLRSLFGATVAGFYAPGRGTIVLVSGDEPPTVDRRTLVHELVHALQHQHERLRLGFGRSTLDGRLAAAGLVEGDANYVKHLYERRCGAGWDCLERPGRTAAGPINRGAFVTVFVPYSDGPAFVAHLRERGGWGAVDAAYDAPPASTEQLVHPRTYPDDEPVDVRVADRSAPGWTRLESPGSTAAERVGEAAIFTTLWANGVVPEGHLRGGDDLSPYVYAHPASDGWEGDAIVPYRSGDRFGYVFRTEWETREDAAAFRLAYVDLLDRNGARARGDGRYRIPEGEPYADAFRVRRNGTAVVVVNAPTVDDLEDVHAPRE